MDVRYGVSVWFTIIWWKNNESNARHPFEKSSPGMGR